MQSHTHSNLKEINDLNPALLRELDKFFSNYHQRYGSKFKVVGHCDATEAHTMVTKAVKRRKTA